MSAQVRSLLAVVFALGAGAVVYDVSRGHMSLELMRIVGERLNVLAAYLRLPHILDGPRLYAFALAGGLIASISPCILGLLPVNLSYIGALKSQSRLVALRSATLFVVGVGIVNVVLGLVSSLFFAVLIEYRGQVNVAVGILMVTMAFWMAGFLPLKVPGIVQRIPDKVGPLVVGIVAGLVVSPCSSPVLVAVLTAAGNGGQALRALEAMIAYTVGYTLVLWLASVFAGVIIASRSLLKHGELIARISATALGLLGIGSVAYGITLLS